MKRKTEGSYAVSVQAVLNAFTYVIGGLAFISVAEHISAAFSVPFAVLVAAALLFDYGRRYEVSRTLLNIALVVFIALNAVRISAADFAAPIVETLVILLAVKLLEEKRARDYLQVYVLSVFLLTGSALLSLDLRFLFILVLLALLLPVSLVLMTCHSEQGGMSLTRRDLGSLISRALLIALVSLPVTAVMFVILPRTGFPMLNFLTKPSAITGFTDTINLGGIADIQENSAAVLRAESEIIDPGMLYWRGITLDHFDGISWRSGGTVMKEKSSRRRMSGRLVKQVIYLEPYDNKYLFALDRPVTVYFRNAGINDDNTIMAAGNISRVVRYTVISMLSVGHRQDLADRERYLQLPARDFGRVRELALSLTEGKDAEAATGAILAYLKKGSFTYSLRNLPVTKNPTEDFLFVHRHGNCEYFASAMAVMLRLASIPSRLTGGYLGGQYNEFGRYYLVTQNMAHVWVEVYIDGKGWIRMDPTPAGSGGGGLPGRSSLFSRLRLMLDFMNYYWNSLIVDYDYQKQMSFFSGLRDRFRAPLRSSFSPGAMVPWVAGALAAAAALWLALLALKRRRSAEKRLVGRFAEKMKRYGYERLSYEGLEEFAGRIEDAELREKALRFAIGLGAVYYRDRKMTGAERAELSKLIDTL